MYVQILSVLTIYELFLAHFILHHSYYLLPFFFLLLQKPGGIIALLDEAWYVTLIYAFQDNLHLYEKNSDCTYHFL